MITTNNQIHYIIMENKKQHYAAPCLTVVEFKAERGYAMSGGTPLADFFQLFDYDDMQENRTQEQWSDHSTWNASGDNFF